MAFLKNLEERFTKTMDDLYSRRLHPSKEPSALHPLIIVRPNDPDRRQGIGNSSRTVPVGRVLTDQERFKNYLTNPTGLKFLLNQQLLQTGNSISETRILNPLFVNLNLGPYEHFKRQLRDQTNISLGSAERSPASTPNIGVAGRLQIETSQAAKRKIINEPNPRRFLLAVLGATQLGNLLINGLGIGGSTGTLRVNERPEFDIGGKLYPVLLREGYEISEASRILNVVADALNFAGSFAGIIGLPGIFKGVAGGGANPIPSQVDQMPYFITDKDSRIQYLAPQESVVVELPTLLKPGFSKLRPDGKKLLNILPKQVSNKAAIGRLAPKTKVTSKLSNDALTTVASKVKNLKTTSEKLTFPERSLGNKYLDKSETRDKRLDFVKEALKEQSDLINEIINNDDPERVPNRGVVGGIDLAQLKAMKSARDGPGGPGADGGDDPLENTLEAQILFDGFNKREVGINTTLTAPGYYHDTLNLFTRIEGRELPSADDGYPQDYINVTIFDRTNNRLEPFRAMLAGLSEAIAPEFTSTRYIGRIEKNIVYTGASRQLTFTLIVHAWSPIELQKIWDKINFITGLAFPSGVSEDGFLLPPIVELTIGDLYKNQPGYFTGITHTISDDTVWEIEPGAQVPRTVEMGLAFDVIEKESMNASSEFYNFGVPRT